MAAKSAIDRTHRSLFGEIKNCIADPSHAAQKTELEAAVKSTTESLVPLKQATAEKEITAFLPSTPLRIRIVDTPFRPAAVPVVSAKPGTDHEVEVKIERLFGFADPVDIALSGTPPIEGLSVTPVQIAAGANSAKMLIKIPATASSASTRLPIKLDYKFNGHALNHTMLIDLNIEAAPVVDATPKS